MNKYSMCHLCDNSRSRLDYEPCCYCKNGSGFSDNVIRQMFVTCNLEYGKIKELRELVWYMDVPSPATPVYRELHEKIQKILAFIDEEL